jgi:hypothetical protein
LGPPAVWPSVFHGGGRSPALWFPGKGSCGEGVVTLLRGDWIMRVLTLSMNKSIDELRAEWVIRSWGLVGGSSHWGHALKYVACPQSPFLSLCHRWAASFATCSPHYDVLPHNKPIARSQLTMDWNLWNRAKIDTFSFKLFFSGMFLSLWQETNTSQFPI